MIGIVRSVSTKRKVLSALVGSIAWAFLLPMTAFAAPSSSDVPAVPAVKSVKDLQALKAGRQIFSDNCSTCHGDHGTEGGVGPSLRNLHARRTFSSTIAWIKNPKLPMPKLFPAALSEDDVKNVAAYVQSL